MLSEKIRLLCTVICVLLLFGCSSGNAPVTPDNETLDSDYSMPVGVSSRFADGTPASGMGALGIFSLSMNADEISAELTPLRQNALTDVLEVVDITNFLQIAPCTDCAKIKSASLDSDGNLVVSIGIKHPFPAGDMLKPISGKNRGDLHVFNVEGTVVSNTAGTTFPGLGETNAGFILVNADGYTPYLDSVLDDIYPTDATVHPYILHFDDYTAGNFDASNPMGFDSVTDPPPSGNLVMAMGCDYDYQDYVFSIDGVFDFIYAVGCTYAVSSANKNQRFTPEYRVPQHNKKAASEVSVEIIANNLTGEDPLSSAEIEIHVVDVSHGVAVGINIDEMFAASSVDDIFIDIPGVTSSLVLVDGNNPVSGTGHDPADPLVYEATIINEASGAEGTYIGLVKVSDNYAPGLNENLLLSGMDGIKRVEPIANPLTGLFDIAEFATYQTFSIDVASGNDTPVAILIPDPDPANITQFQTVDFDGSTSYDTDGTITLYEIDFDWDSDPLNFVADDSNTTGLATSPSYDIVGTFIAGLRVTDDLGAYGYDSVTVDVEEISVIFVDDSNTTGIEDGTQANPYNTIQEGLAAASASEQVWVDDSGNDYAGPIELENDVALVSTNWDDSDGDDEATIYYGSTGAAVIGADQATIEGFEINAHRYGIDCNGTSPEIIDCRIVNLRYSDCVGVWLRNGSFAHLDGVEVYDLNNNTDYGYATFYGIRIDDCDAVGSDNVVIEHTTVHHVFSSDIIGLGGGYCYPHGICINNSDGVQIKNSIVHDVTGGNYHYVYGIRIASSADVELVNNVIYDVDKTYYYGTAYGMHFTSCTNLDVRNIIISHIHKGEGGTGGYYQSAYGVYQSGSSYTFEYNDVYDCQNGNYNNVTPGIGCISSNPAYVNPGTDFHLAAGSPCINKGDPDSSYNDPDGSRNDMGCYGGPGGDW